MQFERQSGVGCASLYQEVTVSLIKKSGKGLGLSVVGRRDGPGVFVSALVRFVIFNKMKKKIIISGSWGDCRAKWPASSRRPHSES